MEAVATIDAEGTITVKATKRVPSGRHRVVVVIDEESMAASHSALPSLAEFRASLGVVPHPGSSVLEGREEGRA